jgi:hypothetical protein
MPIPRRIFNGEDYRQLNKNLPLDSGFGNRCRANALRLAVLKAERKYVQEIGYPKLVRDARMFERFNFVTNMTQLGIAASIWIQRLMI